MKKLLYAIFATLQILLVICVLPVYVICVPILIIASLPAMLNSRFIDYLSGKKKAAGTDYKSMLKVTKKGPINSVDDIIDRSEGCDDCNK